MLFELIPVKSYKKGLVFLLAKTVKDITNHLLKLAKAFSQQLLPQFNAFQNSGAIKACKKIAFPMNR